MKKNTKICVIVGIIFICSILFSSSLNVSFATSTSSSIFGSQNAAQNASDVNLDNILKTANGFWQNVIKNGKNGQYGFLNIGDLMKTITNMVFTVGNLIILVSALLMGLRYVWSGVGGKASIKESAMNMLVGVIFFYMAQAIYTICADIVFGLFVDGVNNFNKLSSNIWSNVAYAVRIFALIGFAAVGIKYMMTSADTRADLKKSLLPVVVGLIIIFCLTNVIGFIINVTSETIDADKNDVSNVSKPTEVSGNVNSDVKGTVNRIWGTANILIQIVSVAIIVFTGLRYMFTSADTRADIKKQTIILVAGAAMVFGAAQIIDFIQKVGKDVIS